MNRSFRFGTAALAAAVSLAACSDTTAPVAPSPDASPSLARAATAGTAPAPVAPTFAQAEAIVPGEVIVGLADEADTARVKREHGVGVTARGDRGRFHVLATTRGNERALAARLRAEPGVAFAEPNYLRQPETIDSRLWAFHNPGGLSMRYVAPGQWYDGQPLSSSYASVADADEDNVESYAAGGADVIVGSLDTGVDFTHPEFTGRLIAGKDWIDGDMLPYDTPGEGHGTHTVGTMAGSKVGVAGVSGAAPHVKVLVQRVCGPSGCPTSAIVNAIYKAADYVDASGRHLVAMNLSLGGTSESSAEQQAIAYATNKGVLVIASAGNSGTGTVACPACDPNAISVGATTWRDARADYSQYGSGLDITAPGGLCYSNTTQDGCIFSAVPAGYTAGARYAGPLAGGYYGYMQGTSMAAPQVTGTAAIVASKTGLRGASLRSRLLSTANDLGTAGYDTIFGYGRLNSYRAVTGVALGAGL